MGYIKSPALSDKARDVLYALFFRGALQSGDIPSKAGANELREAGLAHTQHTVTPFGGGGEDYFTFLTAEGQGFAIQHLVKARYGKALDKPGMDELREMQKAIADSLDDLTERCVKAWCVPAEDKSPVIFLLDRYRVIGGQYTPEEISAAVDHIQGIRAAEALSKAAKEVSPFAIKDGEVFIRDAVIGNSITTANWSMKVNADENGHRHAAGMDVAVDDGKKQVEFKAEKFEITNVKNTLETELQQAINQAVTDAIRNAVKPGGLLYRHNS